MMMLTRRRAGALVAAASLPGRAGAMPPVSLALRKLAFSAGPAPFFWWLRGTRYGLVEGALTPFWDMHIGTLARTVDLPGGGWQVLEIATAFYTDVGTGAFIDHFRNPYTGATVPIHYFPATLNRTTYLPSGQPVAAPGNSYGLASSWMIGPAWVEGGQMFLRFDHVLRGTDAAGRPVRVNDLTTFSGAVADIVNPAVVSAPAGQIFNDDDTWGPWMQMGAQPGTYFARAFGAKVFAYGDMPEFWRGQMAVRHPEIAKDPGAALAG